VIPAAMHRLATRLGIRDGEAYTVVTGLVVALVLGVVGLPGVLRGHDVLPAAEVAGAGAPAPATPVVAERGSSPEAPRSPTPPIPARGLAAAPTTAVAPPGPTDVPPAAPTAATRGRAAGELARFAVAPEPGGADGMAVAANGTVYVASDSASGDAPVLWAFSPDGELLDAWPAPDAPSVRTRGLTGVTVTPGGAVLVADASTARVLRLDREAGSLVPVATVDDLPACGLLSLDLPCEPGMVDRAPLLTAIASAPDGTVVLADQAQGLVWRLAGAEVEVLAALDDRVPGDGPVALSFLTSSELLVAVGARLSSFPPGLPAVLRIRFADGGAGVPELVSDLELGEVPGDVVAGASGRAYVTIPSTGVVVDLGVDQGDRIDLDVGRGEPAVTTPTGIALRERSLLLSEPSGPITDLAVDDGPVTRGPT